MLCVVFGTVRHTEQRAAISDVFPKSSLKTSEPVLQRVVEQLCLNLSQACLDARIVESGSTFLAMTTDAVHENILDKSCSLRRSADRREDWQKTVKAIADLTPTVQQSNCLG